jgi:hypothetical protein
MTAISLRRGSWWSRAARVVHYTPAVEPRPKALCGKDFGALPVCGSVRPVASQRARAATQD